MVKNSSDTTSGSGSADGSRTTLSYLSINAHLATKQLRIISAIGYGLMSIIIMLLSKVILTEFNFKCFIFVAFVQYLSTAIICYIRSHLHGSPYPLRSIFRIFFVDLFPLPMLFMLNTLSGLGATQSLNMPLFVLLRRLSIVMILFGEAVFLRYSHDWEARGAVALMILGAFWATGFGASASAQSPPPLPLDGLIFVLVNDVCTALHSVLTRRKMDTGTIGAEGVLFYINAFAAGFSGILICCGARGEWEALRAFDGWSWFFVFLMLCNALSGFGINYLSFLCMKMNSPLTVSMIGAGKNVFTSYVGMLFRDYTYSLPSFIGVNISVLGCLLYSHREIVRIIHQNNTREKQQMIEEDENPNK